jgi:hypothetical protein
VRVIEFYRELLARLYLVFRGGVRLSSLATTLMTYITCHLIPININI